MRWRESGRGPRSRGFPAEQLYLGPSLPTKQGFCLSRLRWAVGSDLHSVIYPVKGGSVPSFSLTRRSLKLGGRSNLLTFPGAVVGTQLRDINPLSRLFLKLQREIRITSDNLPLQLCFHKYRRKVKIYISGFPG